MRKEADRTDVLSAKRTAMVKCTVISRPSQSVVQMLSRKICDRELRERLRLEPPDAVGICQGSVLEMMEAGKGLRCDRRRTWRKLPAAYHLSGNFGEYQRGQCRCGRSLH